MPFALLVVGLVLIISGVRGTQSDLFASVKGDFTGSNNFVYWALSILVVGALGYVPTLRPLSRGFIVLIVVGLLFNKANGGFFNEFQSALASTQSVSSTATGIGAVLQSQSATAAISSGLSTTLSDSGLPELPTL